MSKYAAKIRKNSTETLKNKIAHKKLQANRPLPAGRKAHLEAQVVRLVQELEKREAA